MHFGSYLNGLTPRRFFKIWGRFLRGRCRSPYCVMSLTHFLGTFLRACLFAMNALAVGDYVQGPKGQALAQRTSPQSASTEPLNEPVDNIQLVNDVWSFKDTYLHSIPIPHAPFPTFGEVTPRPAYWASSRIFYPLNFKDLQFNVDGPSNYILERAIKRYRGIICSCNGLSSSPYRSPFTPEDLSKLASVNLMNEQAQSKDPSVSTPLPTAFTSKAPAKFDPWPTAQEPRFGVFLNAMAQQRNRGANSCSSSLGLECVRIHIQQAGASWPSLMMNESYSLMVTQDSIEVSAVEIWGALRALETLSQLIWCYPNSGMAFINRTFIDDRPRFPHRGIMLDTSRHYLSKRVIMANLEAMEYNKLNVFHWHLSDDQSFPFQSQMFPELSKKAAFRQDLVYTLEDARQIVEFARVRGIRVIPEFDLPGHARSWAYAHPEIVTRCYDNGRLTQFFGPLDPTRQETYAILQGIFTELVQVFPDLYIHLGFDEFELGCWDSNPRIQNYMKMNNIDSSLSLLKHFHIRLQNMIQDTARRTSRDSRRHFIVWQEAYDQGLKLDERTTIQLWKSRYPAPAMVGFKMIFSTCWYLDHVTRASDWMNLYLCDPFIFERNGAEGSYQNVPSNTLPAGGWASNIIGGEACMWAEYQSDETVLQKIWPTASAVAERLWSPMKFRDIHEVTPRLEEQRCRMSRRGIPVSVLSGPGACPNGPPRELATMSFSASPSRYPFPSLRLIAHCFSPPSSSSGYIFLNFALSPASSTLVLSTTPSTCPIR
ncbi:hypothetical protein SprV_0501952700 [Sparganum proliferum]